MLISGGVVFNLCVLSMFYISARSIRSHPLNFWKKHHKTISKRNSPDQSRINEDILVPQLKCVSMETTDKAKSNSMLCRLL